MKTGSGSWMKRFSMFFQNHIGKSYPFWPENLRSERSWKRTIEECPGLYSEDAISIDGDTIKAKMLVDREATRGFRKWPV